MSDIVERLRDGEAIYQRLDALHALLLEAADEIEHLRAELANLNKHAAAYQEHLRRANADLARLRAVAEAARNFVREMEAQDPRRECAEGCYYCDLRDSLAALDSPATDPACKRGSLVNSHALLQAAYGYLNPEDHADLCAQIEAELAKCDDEVASPAPACPTCDGDVLLGRKCPDCHDGGTGKREGEK